MTPRPDEQGEATPSPAKLGADKPLRRDVRMLGFELGQALRQHGRPGLYERVEEIRGLSKQRRRGNADADRRLRTRIESLTTVEIDQLVRALSCFFDLANLAEDRHRIRVLRERERQTHPNPRRESIGAAVEALRSQGVTAAEAWALLERLDIELVFTAHPTEAKRRTVRNALRRLREDLIQLDRGQHLLPREREALMQRMKADVDGLWETDTLRPRRPTVLEEVQRSLFVLDSLWETMPWLYRGARLAFRRGFGPETRQNTHPNELPRFLRFGTWIGGDRDGNPFVTPEVTRETLLVLRRAALERHVTACHDVVNVLSLSIRRRPISEALQAALNRAILHFPAFAEPPEEFSAHEKYRHFLWIVARRLEITRDADPFDHLPAAAYGSADELAADLRLVFDSLKQTGHDALADGRLREWMDQLAVFGFHTARLDIREDGRKLEGELAEILARLSITDGFEQLPEPQRQAVLSTPVSATQAMRLDLATLSEGSRQTIELFLLLRRASRMLGDAHLGVFIVSMTRQPSDVLGVLFLFRLAAALAGDAGEPAELEGNHAAPMGLVPLFETIDDLEHAPATLEALLNAPAYATHLQRHDNRQVCMIGYSDSTKDGGFFAANWHQYQAQERLAEFAASRGIALELFHGRGGSLGRGGGPAARGILSLPAKSVQGRLRITEQGEVLAERYDDPDIAYRHLEQVTWATLLLTRRQDDDVPPAWRERMLRGAQASFRAYRDLIEDDAFVRYFSEATPIESIETLAIGSRPARRRSPGSQRRLEHLRAIPYTFAWTQSRGMITAFYGLGAGLAAAADGDWDALAEMYRAWPFFKAVIDNADLALAKCDMAIAGEYASLVEDQAAGARIWKKIQGEFEASREAVLRVTGRTQLLASMPWLQQSIKVRNPYVDPLNFIQIELMRRLRSADEAPEAEELRELLRLTVQGIAAGLRTTG